MILRAGLGAWFAVVASTQLCLAADPRYPDWPCAQAKVPEISLAAVWAGPPLGACGTRTQFATVSLVRAAAFRRR